MPHRHNFDHLATSPKPQLLCVCCGLPLHTYYQPALVPTKDGHWLVECVNESCPLNMYTLSSDNYQTSISDYMKVTA